MIYTLVLVGHLTQRTLREQLSHIEPSILRQESCILIDALDLDSYDPDARTWFMDRWAPQWESAVRAIAVVTRRQMLRIVVSTLGLATRIRMSAFASERDARTWLEDLL